MISLLLCCRDADDDNHIRHDHSADCGEVRCNMEIPSPHKLSLSRIGFLKEVFAMRMISSTMDSCGHSRRL